jgi:N-acetylated-alpha-linked acidic dipeptidase
MTIMSHVVKKAEKELLDEISLEAPKKILNRFSTLIRESGSDHERIASRYLVNFLEEWRVPHQVHKPTLYLSVPEKASIKLTSPVLKEIKAKTPSFSVHTGDKWRAGEVIYIPTGQATGFDDVFDPKVTRDHGDLSGKIVLTEGFPMSGKVKEFNQTGAMAAIFISPGKNIHEGICTSIWGSPDLDTIDDEPKIPVLAINKTDGQELIELCQKGLVTLEFQTHLEKGWFTCPLVDIFIEGTEDPEKYVLLHGHLDSWHEGIGDNATGDAALIEMARIFYKHRDKLKRSIRIAIWPGHSTGRYAGSTWFADRYALDLDENCIAQVNCDSPGCRWADSYEYMEWMSEAEDLCKQAIHASVNQPSKGTRPLRAGDYSFNNIGITSFYMLSSSIPEEVLQQKQYYPVGGCGANIEWHTEEDLMHLFDEDIMVKDLKVYITTIFRALNQTILPFNFVKTTNEIIKTLQSYQEAAENHVNFDLAVEEARHLAQDLTTFYQRLEDITNKSINHPEIKTANAKIIELARILVPINYSRKGKFRHDPALDVLPLPDIAPANSVSQLEEGSHLYNVTINHLKRGSNRITWALRRARNIVKDR